MVVFTVKTFPPVYQLFRMLEMATPTAAPTVPPKVTFRLEEDAWTQLTVSPEVEVEHAKEELMEMVEGKVRIILSPG